MPTETADIRDIKGLEHFSYSPFVYAVPAVLLVAAALCMWFWIRRRRRMEAPVVLAPPKPVHQLALEALNELRKNDDWSPDGELKFHFALSGILRLYLEARFGIHATDMTSSEIVRALPALADIDEKNRAIIGQLLNDTDLVKFADERRGCEYGSDRLGQAMDIVKETARSLPPDGGRA